jgi:dienelactone hydrolase
MLTRLLPVLILPLVLAVLVGCADGNDGQRVIDSVSYDEQGPYAVGNTTITVLNDQEGRMLTVELWYPAVAGGATQTILDFAADRNERDAMATLLETVPEACTRRDTASTWDAEPLAAPAKLPLVVFSHCFECTRYSSFTLAERLASHGIAVAAPDHLMNTLFDTGAMLNGEFLITRAGDVAAVLDELLIANSAALPPGLQGRFDGARVGVAGHSYGAVTVGKVLQDDARFLAGFIMAAPVENPIIPGVTVERIDDPTLYLVAREDNSIGEIGNLLMRGNFEAATSPTWKVEVADAGHWSFSDIAAIVPGFAAGCGEGVRQTNPGEPFTYVDNALAREIAAAYGVRFFAAHLLADETARQALAESTLPGVVDVQTR